MTEPCTRWMELSDQQLLGVDLAKVDLEFVRVHELECPYCGREAAVLRELRPTALHVVPNDEEVQRILRLAELTSLDELSQIAPRATRSSPLVRGLAGAAAVLALVAAVVLLFGQPEGAVTSRPTASLPAPRPAKSAGARALPPPKAAASGATEDSCGLLVEGIVLCLAAGSEVGQVELTGPRRIVQLKRGRAVASLDPQPSGSSFSIVTAVGEVTAVGTIFSVELANDGRAYARVTRGKVLVRASKLEAEQPLLAGQQLRLGDRAASALPPLEAERDLELVARWLSSADLSDQRAGARAAEPEEGDASEASGMDLGDELGRARDLRARGHFKRAAEIYRSIHARSPRSESGRAALMSLASLQLSSLGDPNGALASYKTYLAGGNGPLRQQAEYGRIRALRRLGRAAEEGEATRAFIRRYPKAPEARLLRERVGGPSGI